MPGISGKPIASNKGRRGVLRTDNPTCLQKMKKSVAEDRSTLERVNEVSCIRKPAQVDPCDEIDNSGVFQP